jgi:UDP-2,3-diacylglucosamine pyrophosphatase LpxH
MNHADSEVIFTVSDLHLSAGGEHEDFYRDAEFAGLLSHILENNGDADHIRLHLLGDIFDPLAVEIDGVFDAPPYERTCMRQMNLIIASHPAFFDALTKFHADPRTQIFFFIGNHDFFIEWDGVQRLIAKRITQGHSHRIRFVYEELHRGFYYTHGNFEPSHAIEMTDRYILPMTNTKTREALLNYPYGSYLTAQTVPKLRKLNPYVGRLAYHGYLYKEAATRSWRIGLVAVWMYVTNFIYNRFFAFWDVRRKTNFWMTLKIVWWIAAGTGQEVEAERLIAKHPNINAVICGHDHKARSVTIPGGRLLNTGTWSMTYDIVWHDDVDAPWGSKILRKMAVWISHFKHQPEFVLIERLPVVVARHSEDSDMIALYNWNCKERRLDLWNA